MHTKTPTFQHTLLSVACGLLPEPQTLAMASCWGSLHGGQQVSQRVSLYLECHSDQGHL